MGTISVAVDDQPARRVNVYSSGSLTESFLHAVVDLEIPEGATLTVTRSAGDLTVALDRLLVGTGSLGLPPDIWNLPDLPVAPRDYTADWRALGLAYTTPEWWREAKLGAWSHWEPQSVPERGD